MASFLEFNQNWCEFRQAAENINSLNLNHRVEDSTINSTKSMFKTGAKTLDQMNQVWMAKI